MSVEDIIDKVGGFGPFQLCLVFFVYGGRMVIAWSMQIMSFAALTPDWWCVPYNMTGGKGDVQSGPELRNNETYEACPSGNMSCTVIWSDDMHTVVNQWGLICGSDHIPETITSIQMAGVLVGSLCGGQSSDTLGRRKTYFIAILFHGICNIIAAFSNSWQMFAALRFLIGFNIGIYLAVSYIYVVESFGIQYRSFVIAFPFWIIGSSILALSAWLRPSWVVHHIIIGSLHIPFLLGWFVVPESLRWLAIKGRVDEAERVVEQMSRYNRKSKPEHTEQVLKQMTEDESRKVLKKYTYLDVFRPWSLAWKSIIIQFVWGCMSMVYYGITFGVGSLSGSPYLNMFLLVIVELPGLLLLPPLTNKLGRRGTSIVFLVIATTSAFGITIVSVYGPDNTKGTIITALAMTCKFGIGNAWGAFIILTSETYPTVIRNLGAGAANTVSRIGGIIAPFVFGMKKGNVFEPFMIVGSVMAVCLFLTLPLHETMGRPLEDRFSKDDNPSHEPHNGIDNDKNRSDITAVNKDGISSNSLTELSSKL